MNSRAPSLLEYCCYILTFAVATAYLFFSSLWWGLALEVTRGFTVAVFLLRWRLGIARDLADHPKSLQYFAIVSQVILLINVLADLGTVVIVRHAYHFNIWDRL